MYGRPDYILYLKKQAIHEIIWVSIDMISTVNI